MCRQYDVGCSVSVDSFSFMLSSTAEKSRLITCAYTEWHRLHRLLNRSNFLEQAKRVVPLVKGVGIRVRVVVYGDNQAWQNALAGTASPPSGLGFGQLVDKCAQFVFPLVSRCILCGAC